MGTLSQRAEQPAPIVGALLGDVMRYSVAALMVVGLGVIPGFRPGGGMVGVLLAVALVLLFAFSVSWIWIVVGMLVKTPESVMTTSFLFLFPLTFASNIFVDPATMPGWLQTVVGLRGYPRRALEATLSSALALTHPVPES